MNDTFKLMFEESALFQESQIERNYKGLTDRDLREELVAYATGAAQNISDLGPVDQNEFTVSLDQASADLDTLKSLLLYASVIAIPDQLFTQVGSMSPLSRGIADTLFGGNGDTSITRRNIAAAAKRLLSLRPAIERGYILPVPVDLMLPPKPLLRLSLDVFHEKLSPSLRTFFRQRAIVNPVESRDGQLLVLDQDVDPEVPCESIYVRFDEASGNGLFSQYISTQSRVNLETRQITQLSTYAMPDKEAFPLWLEQTIEQAAGSVVEAITSDLLWSESLDSIHLTTSLFRSTVLDKLSPPIPSVDERVAKALLELELPVLHHADLNTLCTVRENEGEAYENLRMELARRLRNVSVNESDPSDLEKELQNVSSELEYQVRQVRGEIANIPESLGLNLAQVFTGCLLVALRNPTTELMASVLAADSLVKVLERGFGRRRQLRQSPGYFLWRLSESV